MSAAQLIADKPKPTPAWIRCNSCEDFWCTIHQEHAYNCECPPMEEWTYDPYVEGGPPA